MKGNLQVSVIYETPVVGQHPSWLAVLVRSHCLLGSASTSTGLGLTISKRLVELLGGRISVHSQPNVGTTFSFELPATLATGPLSSATLLRAAQQEPTDSNVLSESLELQHFPLTIAVAEDNTVNQMVIRTMLEKLGAQVSVTNNGEEVVALIQSRPNDFDLILMDCEMPLMDGYQATRQIRQLYADGMLSCPVIIGLSAHALSEFHDRALASGMEDFLTKPLIQKTLINTLSRHFPNAR